MYNVVHTDTQVGDHNLKPVPAESIVLFQYPELVCVCVRACVLPVHLNFLPLTWLMRLLASRRGWLQRAPLVSIGLSNR